MNKRVLLIAVNYNSTKETLDFLKSITHLNKFEEIQVVIIENSNQLNREVDFKNKCSEILKDIIVVETPSNCNYFGSVNYGLQHLGIAPINYDFFIISNVDVLIEDVSFLNKLYSLELRNIGIVAPTVFSTAQGVDQNPYLLNRFNKVLFYYYWIIRQNVLFTKVHEKLTDFIRDKKNKKITLFNKARSIYAPHGAFIIFTKLYFESSGSIDFGLNLFGEELFVAEECKKNNLQVYYEPALCILHIEHVSTAAVSSKYVVDKKRQSVVYFLKNYR